MLVRVEAHGESMQAPLQGYCRSQIRPSVFENAETSAYETKYVRWPKRYHSEKNPMVRDVPPVRRAHEQHSDRGDH
jgi:hypothetical protein